jgi:hypothetical protein
MYDTAGVHVSCSIGSVLCTLLVVSCRGLLVLIVEQSYHVLLASIVWDE